MLGATLIGHDLLAHYSHFSPGLPRDYITFHSLPVTAGTCAYLFTLPSILAADFTMTLPPA